MEYKNSEIFNASAPVITGGCGGSGTRVIAEILKDIRYHIGSDLNDALDNMWFTLLMLSPDARAKRFAADDSFINARIDMFTQLMLGEKVSFDQWQDIFRSAIHMTWRGFNYLGKGSGSWPTRKIFNMFGRRRIFNKRDEFSGWGFKEPNSQVYLPWLVKKYPRMKYIQVVRHGLDMAFSDNRAQWMNWAGLFGIKHPNPAAPSDPAEQLQYWIASNNTAIDCARQLSDNFLLVNFDALCTDSGPQVRRILDFLGVQVDDAALQRLAEIPRLPKSAGRYKQHDLSVFSSEQLDAVRQLGFEI